MIHKFRMGQSVETASEVAVEIVQTFINAGWTLDYTYQWIRDREDWFTTQEIGRPNELIQRTLAEVARRRYDFKTIQETAPDVVTQTAQIFTPEPAPQEVVLDAAPPVIQEGVIPPSSDAGQMIDSLARMDLLHITQDETGVSGMRVGRNGWIVLAIGGGLIVMSKMKKSKPRKRRKKRK